jgi:hypothetical protein
MDRAWLLEGSVLLDDGDQATYAFKAWESIKHGQTRWELRRFLVAAGYTATSKFTSCHARVSDQEAMWKAAFEALGFAVSDHFGYSRQALSQRRSGELQLDDGDAEQEYWVSTIGAIVLFIFWHTYRKGPKLKEQCLQMLRELFDKTVLSTFVASLPLDGPTEDTKRLCDLHAVGSCCSCVALLLADRAWLDGSTRPQQQLASLMVLLNCRRHCLACISWLGELIRQVAGHIDSRPEAWGDKNLLKSDSIWMAGCSGSKRRRADPHMKYIVATSGASSTSELARSHGLASTQGALHWEAEALSQMRSTAILQSQICTQTVSSCLDAARVGRPAEDYLLHLMWDHVLQSTIVAPPQAFKQGQMIQFRLKVPHGESNATLSD